MLLVEILDLYRLQVLAVQEEAGASGGLDFDL